VDGIPAKIVNILRNHYEAAEFTVRMYDITGIKRRRDDSSERTHPGATSVDG